MRLRLSSEPRAATRAWGHGLLCSALLHLLFAALVFLFLIRPAEPPAPALIRFLAIDLVPAAPQATAPAAGRTVAVARSPTRPARVVPSSRRPTVALSPSQKRQRVDPLEIRLKQLAKLRQPDSTLPHPENGASDDAAASDDAETGAVASYRVRDFLRAQVERRWSLDLKHAGNVAIRIHVVVARDGTVTKADIVDRARYASDAAWRAIALSARNAVLLSSPLNLPAGSANGPIDVTLALDPRDALK